MFKNIRKIISMSLVLLILIGITTPVLAGAKEQKQLTKEQKKILDILNSDDESEEAMQIKLNTFIKGIYDPKDLIEKQHQKKLKTLFDKNTPADIRLNNYVKGKYDPRDHYSFDDITNELNISVMPLLDWIEKVYEPNLLKKGHSKVKSVDYSDDNGNLLGDEQGQYVLVVYTDKDGSDIYHRIYCDMIINDRVMIYDYR